MGVLTKLFRRGNGRRTEVAEVSCPHKSLTARWDRPEDIGKEERATSFHCEACGTDFSGEEGRRLLHARSASAAQ